METNQNVFTMFTVMHAMREHNANRCMQDAHIYIHSTNMQKEAHPTLEHERSLVIETKYVQIPVFAGMHKTCIYANTSIMHKHIQPVHLQIETSTIMRAHMIPKNEGKRKNTYI